MSENDVSGNDFDERLVPRDDGRSQSPNSLHPVKPSPLEIAGQIANRAA
ncbi:MAG: hypothetical protein GY803_13080, partial [Chloroflexi bacterium]|nr:hypothetical protein [Chloroflexota bacterium]